MDARATRSELLHRYPGVATRDPDEFRRFLGPLFAISEFDVPGGGRDFDFRMNHRALRRVSLGYGRYGGPVRLRMTQNENFMQGFPVAGHGRLMWNNRPLEVSPKTLGVVGNPGSRAFLEYGAGFAHLILRIEPAAIAGVLEALIGRPATVPFRILGDACDPAYARAQFRLVRFLVDELDRGDALPEVVLAEIEQAIIVNLLNGDENTYSHFLRGATRPAAPWQARRAAAYIDAHCDEPITVEMLAALTNTSARSLYDIFRRTYGVSPMTFIRHRRLARARELLRRPEAGATVASVGFACGFSNLGRFAREYLGAFGELPSATLAAGPR